jgi:hypothetical protein
MMWIGGRATANKTGLFGDEPHVLAIAKLAGFGMAQLALVNACGGSRSIRLSRADLAAFADRARPVKLRKPLLKGLLDVFGVCRN